MTLIRGLDNQGDWLFGHGMSDYRSKNDGIGLDIVTSLKEWKYNWFADFNRGIDWRTRLGSKNQLELLNQDIIDLITSKQEVVSILDFESDLDTNTRAYTGVVKISTIYGEEELQINVGGF